MALELTSHSAEETQRLGVELGQLAKAGDVLLLVGELGTGKTCLTQGIAWGLGIDDYTLSPTFVLIREYEGRLPLYHIDFYRLDLIEEIIDLGIDEYLYGSGLCVVEWAEKGLQVLPQEYMLIRFWYLAKTKRKLSLEPQGKRYQEMLCPVEKWNWP